MRKLEEEKCIKPQCGHIESEYFGCLYCKNKNDKGINDCIKRMNLHIKVYNIIYTEASPLL